MIFLLQWLNQAILGPTAIVLDLARHTVRGLYGGFRAVAVELGASLSVSSIISGFIVTGILLALIWIGTFAARRFRLKNPGPTAILAGTVLFWVGCVIGIYFLGVIFYVLGQPDFIQGLGALELVGYLVGTIVLYPAAGRLIRYLLGR